MGVDLSIVDLVHVEPILVGFNTVNVVDTTEDIGYYDNRPVTLLFVCFISFQRYALSYSKSETTFTI